ncbi:unnamed protein product [Pleuronectes platessa]|uniref:Uncharacterized protein n=1 Tax=Pleuronectes platessa TaxID=8262 RepID=A0A9N7VH42_PLEPL|nr:unnamed protein product [Pleuronectes platessa]
MASLSLHTTRNVILYVCEKKRGGGGGGGGGGEGLERSNEEEEEGGGEEAPLNNEGSTCHRAPEPEKAFDAQLAAEHRARRYVVAEASRRRTAVSPKQRSLPTQDMSESRNRNPVNPVGKKKKKKKKKKEEEEEEEEEERRRRRRRG